MTVFEKFRSPSIKALLFAAIGCLSVLSVAPLGWMALAAWQGYREAITQKELDAGGNRLITGLYEMFLERVDTNNALRAAAPASDQVKQKLAAHRKIVKDNIGPGLAAIEPLDFPDKQKLTSSLILANKTADDYRAKADAAIALPLDQRDKAVVQTFYA